MASAALIKSEKSWPAQHFILDFSVPSFLELQP
jgi:hypothetical protein